ncbi:MAG: outer membrane protein assembly factor BamA [bacterium]
MMRGYPIPYRTGAATLLVLAALLLALPGAVGAQGGSNPTVTVTEIRVEGNVSTSRSLILVSSGLAEGRAYDLASFTDATGRAIRQLWRLGLFSDVEIWAEQLGGTGSSFDAVLIIRVVERPKVASITFQGNDDLKRRELLEAAGLREGTAQGPSSIARAMDRIREKYREEGRLRAELDYEFLYTDSDSTLANLAVSIEEGPKVGITDIEVLGNRALSDRQVKGPMETGTGFLFFSRGKYDRRTLEEDKERIAQAYADRGYLDARVVADSLAYDEDGKDMTVVLTVDEGEQYTLGSLTWEGLSVIDSTEVAEVVQSRPGEAYSEGRIRADLQAVNGLYFEEGYVYANVVPQESYEGRTVHLTMMVREGEPANVAHIFITGNTKTKEHVIRRELLLKPGDRFSNSLFQRSIREVMALNFFANVELDPPPTPTASGDLDVTIKVTEKPTGQATMGAGFSERDGLIGNLGLSLPNLFGNGQELDFQWDFGRIRRTISFGFTEPWFMNTPTLVGFNIYSSELFWTTFYKQKRQGFSFRVGRRLRWPDDYFRTSVGYRVEDTSFLDFSQNYNPSPAYDLRQYDWPIRNSSVSWTVSRDSRDQPEFPTSGSSNSLRIEVAGGPFGGDEQYVKWDLSQSFFTPAWWNLVMNMRIRAGLVEGYTGYGQSGFVPFQAKYLPGGTSFDGQIRGYENRRVGPKDRDGLEVGGQSLLIFTLEYTFPLAQAQSLYGLFFAEAGNAWQDLGDTDPFDLRRSVGFGLRMFTPLVGLIGFDFAYGLDHFVDGRRQGRWVPHFQFGYQFY